MIRQNIEEKKEELNAMHTEAREEVLIERISRVESAADSSNNWESWNIMSEITGR